MKNKSTKIRINTKNLIDKFIGYCNKSNFKIGKLKDGRIYAYKINGNKKYYISSGIHGNEPAGPIALTMMMKMNLFPKNATILIFPCLNPDGFERGTRSDSHGIDLNRDYKLQKSNKTKLHKNIINKFGTPDVSIILHEDWESDGFYIYKQCNDKDYSDQLINSISKNFPIDKHNTIDNHKVFKPGIINVIKNKPNRKKYTESLWLWKLGCPQNYIFETPSNFNMIDRVKTHINACKTLFNLLSY